MEFARSVRTMYEDYRIVGFDEDQAFKLTVDFARTLINGSLKAQAGDKLHGIHGNLDSPLRRA
jgi:hypothetical protein